MRLDRHSVRPSSAASTAAAARGHSLRFPCGHVHSEAIVAEQLRERNNAIWIKCPRCNVVALAMSEAR